MQNSSSILPDHALADLNRQLDRALTYHDRAALAGVRAVSSWLIRIEPSPAVRQLAARTDAAQRFMGGRSHV